MAKLLESLQALRASDMSISSTVDVRLWDAVVSSFVGEHVDLNEASVETMLNEVLNLKGSDSWRSLPRA